MRMEYVHDMRRERAKQQYAPTANRDAETYGNRRIEKRKKEMLLYAKFRVSLCLCRPKK